MKNYGKYTFKQNKMNNKFTRHILVRTWDLKLISAQNPMALIIEYRFALFISRVIRILPEYF